MRHAAWRQHLAGSLHLFVLEARIVALPASGQTGRCRRPSGLTQRVIAGGLPTWKGFSPSATERRRETRWFHPGQNWEAERLPAWWWRGKLKDGCVNSARAKNR